MFVDPGTFSAGRGDADALRRITPSRRALIGATAAGLVTAGVASLLPSTGSTQTTRTDLGKTLIAYFSLTGNTRAVANQIRQTTQGELFEIRTTYAYPDAYRATTDQAKREQEENARPTLAADVEGIESYDTVFLGFPNWWTTMPMTLFTFLERHRLSGKTIAPFCTHEGSRFGQSLTDIRTLCPNARLLDGLALRGGASGYVQSDAARQEIADWLRRL